MLRLQDLPDGAIVQLYYRSYEQGYSITRPYFATYIITFNDGCVFFSNVESKYEDNFSLELYKETKWKHYNPRDINNLINFGFDKKYIIVYGIYILEDTNNKEKESYSLKPHKKMNIYHTKCIYDKDIKEISEDEIQAYSRWYNNRFGYTPRY